MSEQNELLQKTEQLIKMAKEAIAREQEETDRLILENEKESQSHILSSKRSLYTASAFYAKICQVTKLSDNIPDTSTSMMLKKDFTDKIDIITNYYDGIDILDQAAELLEKSSESLEAAKITELLTAITNLRKTLVEALKSHTECFAKTLQNINDSVSNG